MPSPGKDSGGGTLGPFSQVMVSMMWSGAGRSETLTWEDTSGRAVPPLKIKEKKRDSETERVRSSRVWCCRFLIFS